MGHYTTFHFRVKLHAHLPAAVAATLQAQCGPWNPAHPRVQSWQVVDQLTGGDLPQASGVGFNWAGWSYHPHPFFLLPRADSIPRGTAEGASTPPVFRRYAQGGAMLSFTCALKNYDEEIESFLDWIAPYVSRRFGKRRHGRHLLWVGWLRPESADQAYNIFLVPACRTTGTPPRVVIAYPGHALQLG